MEEWSTKGLDVVYMCKKAKTNDELRFSLRSVQKNLECGRVAIFGGCPDGIKPDLFFPLESGGCTKWEIVHNNFMDVARCRELTDKIILFNDDFYVLKPTDRIPPMYRSSLFEHIVRVEMKFGDAPNAYSKNLRKCVRDLEGITDNPLSYELHVPMILDRQKFLDTLLRFPDGRATRTLYGNYHKIGGVKVDDVKILSSGQEVDLNQQFLSTSDKIFDVEEIFSAISGLFPEKSRFER